VSFVQRDDDELRERGNFDEEHVYRVQSTRRQEPRGWFENQEGENIEWRLVGEQGVRFHSGTLSCENDQSTGRTM